MARSQLRRAVTRLPFAAAALPRASLAAAVPAHSRYQELLSAKSIRLAVSQHSDTVAPPSWAAASNLMNSSERSSRSGQQIHPSRFRSKLIAADVSAPERCSQGFPSRRSGASGDNWSIQQSSESLIQKLRRALRFLRGMFVPYANRRRLASGANHIA